MAEDDRQTQLAELEALQSCFREDKIKKITDWDDPSTPIEGSIQIDFDNMVGNSLRLKGIIENRPFSYQIKCIPPVDIEFSLPADYPSVSSPMVFLKSIWMSVRQLTYCQTALEETCAKNEGFMVLYFCCQTLIDIVSEFNLESINVNRAAIRNSNPLLSVRELKDLILEKIANAADEMFANTGFACKVCLDTVPGNDCYKFLPCEHVACKSCVSGYYQSIAEGMINGRMKCLEPGCETESDHKIVQEALGEELYAKYDEALLQLAIRDADTVICARETCNMPAYITDRQKHLVECSYCGYNFCQLCKQTYHGVDSCKLRKEELAEIVKVYQEGDDDERTLLFEKYGGEVKMSEIINMYLNSEWISGNTKPCPSCRVHIEKQDGCHKMHCTSCGVYFCWLCNNVITNGYAHFNAGGPCDGKLLDGIADDFD